VWGGGSCWSVNRTNLHGDLVRALTRQVLRGNGSVIKWQYALISGSHFEGFINKLKTSAIISPGGVAQVVEGLPCKHEALSSNLKRQKKKN
jgi:hypothetical protein